MSRTSASKIAIALAALLAVSKALVGYFSGSLVVLGSAMDSMFDVLASSINFIFIKKADEPPDRDHPFGHGKFESYASFLQSIIIFGTGCFLMYEAYNRFMNKAVPAVTTLTVAVMILSIIVSLFITLMLRRVGKREGSLALQADSAHYSMDLVTNAGVLIALFLIKFSGIYWLDPVIGVAIALYIVYSAIKIHWSALKILLDSRIPEEDYSSIIEILKKYAPYYVDYHRLRTRTDGNRVFVDVHLLLCADLTLSQAHALCDLIEEDMKNCDKNVDLTIHPEPCEDNCGGSCSKQQVVDFLKSKGIHFIE